MGFSSATLKRQGLAGIHVELIRVEAPCSDTFLALKLGVELSERCIPVPYARARTERGVERGRVTIILDPDFAPTPAVVGQCRAAQEQQQPDAEKHPHGNT